MANYKKRSKIEAFRLIIEMCYKNAPTLCGGSFGEILCYEMHEQPINPRLEVGDRGLTFLELAEKWGISVSFLGEIIADHCNKL